MAEDAECVTTWIALLKAGDSAAAQPLWEHYFTRLVHLVRSRLPQPGADHEVIASSSFRSFCLAAAGGRFPRLDDRHDLWRLLVAIAGRKVADHLERDGALKRGGGVNRAGEDALLTVIGREPTPEFAVSVAEEFERLIDRLGDDVLRRIAVWKMEGFTNREVGERLGCAERTVANKLELIRKILRAEVSP